MANPWTTEQALANAERARTRFTTARQKLLMRASVLNTKLLAIRQTLQSRQATLERKTSRLQLKLTIKTWYRAVVRFALRMIKYGFVAAAIYAIYYLYTQMVG